MILWPSAESQILIQLMSSGERIRLRTQSGYHQQVALEDTHLNSAPSKFKICRQPSDYLYEPSTPKSPPGAP